MPSVSKSQQASAGIAHAVEKGDLPKSKLRGASKRMFKSMKSGDLRKFAKTKHKGLPDKVGEGLTARRMFERERLTEGRDDAPKLGLGKTGLKFARMQSKEAFKPGGGAGGDAKWHTSAALRSELAGEKPNSPMKNKDAVGPVKHAFKEMTKPKHIVSRLLDDE